MNKSAILVVTLVVVFAIFLFPFYYNVVFGKFNTEKPELQQPKGDHCVEDSDWMKVNHRKLLKDWRFNAIREGKRKYKSKTYRGETYNISTNTCFECHESKKKFCDKCHSYVGASPDCWNCHITPGILEEK